MPQRVRFNAKAINLTVIADSLSSNAIAANTFSELGQPKNVFQVPQVAVLEYSKYVVMVEAAERRAVVVDNTGEMSVTSPLPAVMKKLIQATEGIAIAAIGFNYIYECVTEGPSIEIMRGYINESPFQPLGTLKGAGIKITAEKDGRVIQLNIDPVFDQPTVLAVTVNHHFDKQEDWFAVIAKFAELTIETPALLKRVFNEA